MEANAEAHTLPARTGGDMVGFAAAFAIVVGMCVHNGSYFSTSWGWQAMAFFGLAATGLIFMISVRVFRLQALFFAGMTAFVAWVGLSAFWSDSVPGSVRELERDIVYVGLALALAVFGKYLASGGLVLGLFAGITAVTAYALTTRLFPTHFAAPDPTLAYRLSVPLGYWNALGLLAAMGLILALAAAAHSNARTVRMVAGAATCVIAPAMLFTFSRGAWAAAAIGLIAMAALDSRRIELAAAGAGLAAPVACLIWLGATSRPLTDADASVAEAADAGRRYALAVLLLACVAAVLVELAHAGISRLDPGLAAERRFGVIVVAMALVLASVVVIAGGGPVRAADRGWSAFSGGLDVSSDNLSERFRSFSNHGRIEHWRVAGDDFRANPVLGSGAGTYEQIWYAQRGVDVTIRDAHSLYLEVLAELGVVGLLLLLFSMAIPLVGCVLARSAPYVPAAAGAFVAYASHAAIDWDWELVGLTAAALVAGGAGLVAAGSRGRPLLLGRPLRVAVAAVAIVATVFAFVGFVGNRELAASRQALVDGNTESAVQHGKRATRTLRWSVEPLLALGEAQRDSHDLAGARASFEDATLRDPGNWRAWLALSEVSVGKEHRRSLAEAHRLNPIGVPA